MSTNIYQSPASELETGTLSLKDLPRFSAWWVFLLSIVTLYFYAYYWLYSRSTTLNGIIPERIIPPAFMVFTIVFSIGTWILDLADLYFDFGLQSELWSTPASLMSNILIIVWSFMIKSRLTQQFYIEDIDIKVGGLGTFILGPIYLANRINHARDILNARPVELDYKT